MTGKKATKTLRKSPNKKFGRRHETQAPGGATDIELAIAPRDVVEDGFGTAVARAAKLAGGEVLFSMPTLGKESQEIAAVAMPGGAGDGIVFVRLGNDGESVSIGRPEGPDAVFASLGETFADVMRHLRGASPAAMESVA